MKDLQDIASKLEEQLNCYDDIECSIEDELSEENNVHIIGFIYTENIPDGLLFNLFLDDEYILFMDFFICGNGFPLDIEKFMAIQSFANKNEEKYNVIFDDSSADVTVELEPLVYSEEKANLIHDRIFEFAIDSDVIELIKYYFKVYYCPKCKEQLFFEPVNNTKIRKYHCDRCNEYYDAKDIINGLEEIIIRE